MPATTVAQSEQVGPPMEAIEKQGTTTAEQATWLTHSVPAKLRLSCVRCSGMSTHPRVCSGGRGWHAGRMHMGCAGAHCGCLSLLLGRSCRWRRGGRRRGLLLRCRRRHRWGGSCFWLLRRCGRRRCWGSGGQWWRRVRRCVPSAWGRRRCRRGRPRERRAQVEAALDALHQEPSPLCQHRLSPCCLLGTTVRSPEKTSSRAPTRCWILFTLDPL